VNIDRGELEIYQNKEVVEEVENLGTEISMKDAQKIEPDMQLGDLFVDVIDPTSFGRQLMIYPYLTSHVALILEHFRHWKTDSRRSHFQSYATMVELINTRILFNDASQLCNFIKGYTFFSIYN
jgi:hypothetical protein